MRNTTRPERNTAVIYARFSSHRQRDASIEDQLRVCRSWCDERGYSVVAEYCDHARTGRSDDRPEFQRMMANAGESEVVLVYMMDRFSRDAYDAPYYKRRLAASGVRVVSAMESLPDGPEAILVEKVYEGLAAVESAHIAIRTRRGMEGNALKCMHNGAALFGYDCGSDGMYHVNEGQAELVREMFARRASGESFASIAEDMAARGVESTQHTPCSPQMVSAAIRNEKYLGVYSWGGTRVEGGMPAIVDPVTFRRAGMVRTKRRRSEQWTDYALSGRATCQCGASVVGVSGRGRHDVKYSYYRCADRCGVRPVRADWLEDELAHQIRRALSDRETVSAIAQKLSEAFLDHDATQRAEAARKRLRDVDGALRNIMRAVERGMDYDDVRDRVAELKEQRDRARADEELWSGLVGFDQDALVRFLTCGKGMTDRELIEAMVWHAWFSDDRVEAVICAMDGNKPATLEVSTGSHKLDWLPTHSEVRTGPSIPRLEFPVGEGVSLCVYPQCITLEMVYAA